jgi:hypothetical protein
MEEMISRLSTEGWFCSQWKEWGLTSCRKRKELSVFQNVVQYLRLTQVLLFFYGQAPIKFALCSSTFRRS